MRSNKIILAMGLLILGVAVTGSAMAQRHAYRHGGGYHGGHGGYYGGHRGHSHFSFGLGLGWPGWGWGYPYYGGYPYYYGGYPYYGGAYAPSYYAPYPYYGEGPVGGEAPEYIERGDGGGAPPYAERSEPAPQPRRRAEGTWHFCPESNGYYPYVQQCPGGWQRVPARPPADSGAVR